MSITVDPQNTSAENRTTDSAARAPEADGGASLDKVRDLLFGVQVRDFERKFARIEERLIKETNDLREDVRKRLGALEQLLTKEIESLSERLTAEHDQRLSGAKDLSRQIDDTSRTFEKKTTQIDDQLARGLREVRQQLHEQQQQLSDDLKRQADQILERLARDAHELRTEKTDRAALAGLLTEMAMRLTDDFRLPNAEDSPRA